MKPDLILANAPFGKPGVDITKYIMENFPDANYAMLNTRSAFKKYYDKLACQYATIGKYLLGTNENLHWVEQAILLATNGWTEVVDNRKKDGGNKVGVNKLWACLTGSTGPTRNTHLVQMSQGQIPQEAYTRLRNATLVQVNKSGPYLGATMDTKPTDVKLRNGYIYVSFETFEEACECAIDIISWTNPTDSHYRCVKYGFVTDLRSHEKHGI